MHRYLGSCKCELKIHTKNYGDYSFCCCLYFKQQRTTKTGAMYLLITAGKDTNEV